MAMQGELPLTARKPLPGFGHTLVALLRRDQCYYFMTTRRQLCDQNVQPSAGGIAEGMRRCGGDDNYSHKCFSAVSLLRPSRSRYKFRVCSAVLYQEKYCALSRPFLAMAWPKSGSRKIRSISRAIEPGSSGSNSKPHPSSTSGRLVVPEARTGIPEAIASTSCNPNPS